LAVAAGVAAPSVAVLPVRPLPRMAAIRMPAADGWLPCPAPPPRKGLWAGEGGNLT